jgi:dipeptidyl aminopeptidase/acylaminoacyl peptidase
VRAQPWADPARVAISGKSAGGYYALLGLAHQPELWRAGVCFAGMYDLASTLRSTDGDLRAYLEQELAPLDEPELLARLSPSTYVDRIRAPVFVVAGSNDPRAPASQAEAAVRDLRARGRHVEYMLMAGQGHGFDDPRVRTEFFARLLRFLKHALAG